MAAPRLAEQAQTPLPTVTGVPRPRLVPRTTNAAGVVVVGPKTPTPLEGVGAARALETGSETGVLPRHGFRD